MGIVICAAYSHELPRYGVKVGLTNYAAAYCTGLLLARRVLQKFKLDTVYEGNSNIDGTMFYVEDQDDGPGAFGACLDVGLARTSTGAKVFAALKGAVDGGLDIPHSEKRFPGYITKKKSGGSKDEYQADVHADKIYGGHIRDYMEKLQEKEPEKYQKHFSKYIAQNLGPENLKNKYQDVHRKIRSNPSPAPKKKRDYKTMKLFPQREQRLNAEQRRQRRIAKIEQLASIGNQNDENKMEIEEEKQQ